MTPDRGPARYAQSRAKLADCAAHGPGSGAELFLVEGDSARDSVLPVRDERCQAVLPLQGKPLNTWAASAEKVQRQVLFQQLAQALGLESPTAAPAGGVAALRYERVLLLFDPDADGIHIGALMTLYFARWLPALLDAGALWLVRAPMFELVDAQGEIHHAWQPPQCERLVAEFTARDGGARPMVRTLRGLGGLAPQTLQRLCVQPGSRIAHAVTAREVQAVLDVFGDSSKFIR